MNFLVKIYSGLQSITLNLIIWFSFFFLDYDLVMMAQPGNLAPKAPAVVADESTLEYATSADIPASIRSDMKEFERRIPKELERIEWDRISRRPLRFEKVRNITDQEYQGKLFFFDIVNTLSYRNDGHSVSVRN